MDANDLVPVHDPPHSSMGILPGKDEHGKALWKAHESCALVVPETWVDEIEVNGAMVKYIFGVDAIVKDRWNLVSHQSSQLLKLAEIGLFSDVQHAHDLGRKHMEHRFNVPKANARNLSMSLVLFLARNMALHSRCSLRSRRKSCWLAILFRRSPLGHGTMLSKLSGRNRLSCFVRNTTL
jgi:hypothetical protein